MNFKIFFYNFKFFIKKRAIRFSKDKYSDLYIANENNDTHYFPVLERGYTLYSKGLKSRGENLAKSYFINEIDFKLDDIVIDCGANNADLYLFLKNKIHSENYITFEPGKKEYQAINRNAPNSENFQKGLSNQSGTSVFYMDSDNADSSIIEPENFKSKISIETITLEEFLQEKKVEKIKLFKLEAEGFEPEILQGANKTIHRFEYIAIDGGNERGKEKKETLSYACNYLINANFELLSINFSWGRALFKNKNSV